MPIRHGSPLQRWQGRGRRGITGQLLSTPRASGVGAVEIGPSSRMGSDTPFGAPGGASGDWFSLGACGIPPVRRKDAQSRILGNGDEKPYVPS